MNWVIFATCFAATLTVACATLCRTAEDCPTGYCCVAKSLLQLEKRGLCLKLARKGKTCSEPESQLDVYGGKYTRSCPCQEGLSCQPKILKSGKTDPGTLKCQEVAATLEPETTPLEEISDVTPEEETGNEGDGQVDEGTGDEGTGDEGTGDEGTGDEGTGDEGTGDEGTGDEGTGDEGTGDEGTGDEGTGDEGTGDEGTGDEGTGDEGTGDEGTGDEGTGDEGTGDEGTGDEGTGDEGTGDEVVDEGTGDEGTGDEVVDEGTGGDQEENEGNDEVNNEEIPAEIAEGPGGEKPRDDDCIDWEYPC